MAGAAELATAHWKGPRPDPEIVEVLERALAAAKKGHIRCILICTVNPLHEPECVTAGDITSSKRHVMIGALSSAAHKLIQQA